MSESGRRTVHGAECPQCGSASVVVSKTETRTIDAWTEPGRGRRLRRKQWLRCLMCQHGWLRETAIEERIMREDGR